MYSLLLPIICILISFIQLNYCIETHYVYESCNGSSLVTTSIQLETSKSLTYALLMDCSYTISVPNGKTVLALKERFEVEPRVNDACVDYLNVHDGADISSPLLNSGPLCAGEAPKNFTSSGPQMTFHFVSDKSAVFRGFEFIISAVENAPCSSSQFSCLNGLCIDGSLKCDSYKQCGDNSDESDCSVPQESVDDSDNTILIVGLVIGISAILFLIGVIGYRVYRKNQWKDFLHQQLEDPDVWNATPSYPVTRKYFKTGRGNYNTLTNENFNDGANSTSHRDDLTELS